MTVGWVTVAIQPACTGPIAVQDPDQVQRDIRNIRAATEGLAAADVFLSTASPGVIALFLDNHDYPSREAYLQAIAEAMQQEYEAIARAGLVLQVDCPDLAMGRHIQLNDASLDEFRRQARLNVEALNYATRNIDLHQMRMHLCWGNYEGPHHRDVALRDVEMPTVDPKITWAKFAAMAEGARLATQALRTPVHA